jgi:hypothetical protein
LGSISSHDLIGPFFFNETVNADRHLLQNNFVPELVATQMPLHTQWFMQDGATPHTANKALNFLQNTFGALIISHRYPLLLLSLTATPQTQLEPMRLILWDFLKERAFPPRPANIVDWRAAIIQLCGEITQGLHRNAITNIGVRLQEVIKQNCAHNEHDL